MGRTAAAALVALVGILFLGPAAAQITDTDVINFAINLECLEVRTESHTEAAPCARPPSTGTLRRASIQGARVWGHNDACISCFCVATSTG